jgi:hypothetical protein
LRLGKEKAKAVELEETIEKKKKKKKKRKSFTETKEGSTVKRLANMALIPR